MAFLVLALSVLPCADAAGKMSDKSIQSSVVVNTGDQENQDHKDACTPFCHCTCCASTSINHFFAVESSLVDFENLLYSSYLPENLFDFSPPIWQPPQLA